MDDPDDLLLEEQEDDRDGKARQSQLLRITLDEELGAEAIILDAVLAKKEKQSADAGSTAGAMRLKDGYLTQEDHALKRLKRDLRLEVLRRLEVSARYP